MVRTCGLSGAPLNIHWNQGKVKEMKFAKLVFGVGIAAFCVFPVMGGPPPPPRYHGGGSGVRLAADIVDLVGAAIRIPAAIVAPDRKSVV